MKTTLASEVQMLAHRLNRISERSPRSRDFTLNSLRRALVEFLSNLTVYRTYLDPDRSSPQDIVRLEAAAAAGRHRARTLEPSLFRFIVAVLAGGESATSLDYPPVDLGDTVDRRRFAQRLQQFSGSVFAKGVEDTALYRYHPLLSLNEVGGDPRHAARPVADFHRQNHWRAGEAPFGFLTTATHDTKLGEDVRVRIDALSEFAGEWTTLVRRWRRRVASLRVRSDSGWMPDPNDEYRCFQILAGTWPIDPSGAALAAPSAEYEARIADYLLKSVKEAKRHTTWINPDAGYEDAVRRLVKGVLAGPACRAMRADAESLLVRVARVGAANALSQLVLKLTSPGVADIYQGGELWDFNLVDPDNRRPVDFAMRARLLDDLEPLLRSAAAGDAQAAKGVRALLEDWPSGRIKLFVTAALLRARRERPDLFLEGEYLPIDVSGASAGRLVAFARRRGSCGVLVVAPHLVAPVMTDGAWPVGSGAWAEDCIDVDRVRAQFPALNLLTGESLAPDAAGEQRGGLRVADLLAQIPIGVWMWGR
jgi:(1->4)-alpha-D-glucan 1-alpha-D-glucosylmutase